MLTRWPCLARAEMEALSALPLKEEIPEFL
jgi:hypothetical protein